jgi:hypothetical protein
MVEQNGKLLSFSTWLEDGHGVDEPVVMTMETEFDERVGANESRLDVEIKAVLMASLEAKVLGLEEDGWMFGDEEKEEDQ